jgi:hypothetical protein
MIQTQARPSDQRGAVNGTALDGHTSPQPFGPQPQNGVAGAATPKRRRARKDDVEFKGFARRMIRAYGRRAADADPNVLGDLLSLRDDLDQAIAAAVVSYREAGLSWAAIGYELGIDRVTCFKRFSRYVQDESA